MRRWIVATCLALSVGCGGDDDGDGSNPGADGGGDPADPDGGSSHEEPYGDCAGGGEDTTPPDAELCLHDETNPNADPIAVIEYEFVTYEGQGHVKVAASKRVPLDILAFVERRRLEQR